MRIKVFAWYTMLFSILIAIDRITKMFALVYLNQQPYMLNKIVSFCLVFNRGISWGLFYFDNTVLFVLISIIITMFTFLVALLAFKRFSENKLIFGEVMVLAGSISNLFDRVLYGGVIDFIRLSYKGWSWPIFNIADMCIVCGVICMTVSYFFEKK